MRCLMAILLPKDPSNFVHSSSMYDFIIKVEDGKVDIIKNTGVFIPSGKIKGYTVTPEGGPTMLYKFDGVLLDFLFTQGTARTFLDAIRFDAAKTYEDFL